MKSKLGIIIAILLALGVMAYAHFSQPKIAYVRSEILVNEYAGMKEASELWQRNQLQWQVNLDTLRADYRKKEKANAPKEELQLLAQNIQQYTSATEQMAMEEDRKKTEGVLEQINVFVEQCGEEHGYDLILGTTASGNILYGKPGIDITEKLLAALNQHYNPASYGQ